MKRLRWMVVLVSATGGCVPSLSPAQVQDPVVAATTLPSRNLTALTTPDHVEAYAVGTTKAHPGFGGKLAGFGVYNSATLSPDDAREFGAAAGRLLKTAPVVSQTGFSPVFGCRFYVKSEDGQGQESADVLVDDGAQTMLVVMRDPVKKEIGRRLLDSSSLHLTLSQIARRGLMSTTEPATEP